MASVTLDGERVLVRTKDGAQLVAIKPEGEQVTDRLISKNVEVRVEPQQQSGFFSLISLWLPFLVLIGIWIFFMNRMQGGGRGGAMGFRQVAREAADRKAWPRDVRRRGRHRRGQGRA